MDNPFSTFWERSAALKAIQHAKTEQEAEDTLAFIIEHYQHALDSYKNRLEEWKKSATDGSLE